MDEISDERLEKLDRTLSEQIRLLERRLSRSAIPEDEWEFGPALEDAQLKLALVTELRDRRAACSEAVAWGDAGTVGNMIAQLKTFDPKTPVYGAFHAEYHGERRPFVRGLTMSRERINGRKIDQGNEAVPYSVVVWSAPEGDPDLHPSNSGVAVKALELARISELEAAIDSLPITDQELVRIHNRFTAVHEQTIPSRTMQRIIAHLMDLRAVLQTSRETGKNK